VGAYRAEAEVPIPIMSKKRSLVTVTRGFGPLELKNRSFTRNIALDHDVSFIFLCFAGFFDFLLSLFIFCLKRTYSNSKSCHEFHDAISKTKVNMKKGMVKAAPA
jgi:hypothetical protein